MIHTTTFAITPVYVTCSAAPHIPARLFNTSFRVTPVRTLTFSARLPLLPTTPFPLCCWIRLRFTCDFTIDWLHFSIPHYHSSTFDFSSSFPATFVASVFVTFCSHDLHTTPRVYTPTHTAFYDSHLPYTFSTSLQRLRYLPAVGATLAHLLPLHTSRLTLVYAFYRFPTVATRLRSGVFVDLPYVALALLHLVRYTVPVRTPYDCWVTYVGIRCCSVEF